jgi:hypothetical protein
MRPLQAPGSSTSRPPATPAGAQSAPGAVDADMSGPAWLTGGFAVLMIMVAICCAGRLAVSRVRGKDTELDTDGLHVLMGVAMAGMLEPRLSPVPGTIWRAVFAAAAAWFAWQAIRARSGRPRGWRCAHPAPHAVECAAMIYMLLPAGSRPSGRGPGMAMPGMNGAGAAGNPALTLVLALFMLGYILWTIDRLASPSPAAAATPAHSAAPSRLAPAAVTASAAARVSGTARPGSIAHGGAPGRAALAPRLATGYKIAMGIGMGYMLVMML